MLMLQENFDILATSLSILHNYLDCSIKLFSDPHLAKFLDTSTKPFFPCSVKAERNITISSFDVYSGIFKISGKRRRPIIAS